MPESRHRRTSPPLIAAFKAALPAKAPMASLKIWQDWATRMIIAADSGHTLNWVPAYRTIDDEGDDTWAQMGKCACEAWLKIEWDGQSRWSPQIEQVCPLRPISGPPGLLPTFQAPRSLR